MACAGAWVSLSVAIGLISVAALASDGVLEINQACATSAAGCFPGDTGGLPVEITQRGSYRLTSDLVVPASTNGIELRANDVSLDLNGFAVRGPFACASLICPAGAGSGIVHAPLPFPLGGSNARVMDGTVSGFASDCISVGDGRFEGLLVQHCGGDGIQVLGASVVIGNRVRWTRDNGLALSGSTAFQNNVVEGNGYGSLAGTGGVSVVGGKPTGGNVCGDGRCSARGAVRRFYLTRSIVNGAQALGACVQGFHMASLWEIVGLSTLEYDAALGQTEDDSGAGPPAADFQGWIRTGDADSNGAGVVGVDNCRSWTSDSGIGATAKLAFKWIDTAFLYPISPWVAENFSCNLSLNVWCIED